MAFDGSTIQPDETLKAKIAEAVRKAFADRAAGIRPAFLVGVTSFEGLGDSVRLANEHRLRGEDR